MEQDKTVWFKNKQYMVFVCGCLYVNFAFGKRSFLTEQRRRQPTVLCVQMKSKNKLSSLDEGAFSFVVPYIKACLRLRR